MAEVTKRYAVVTGANKGIGLEICKQLASKGIMVVLTARDEKRGLEAVEKLKEYGLSDNVQEFEVLQKMKKLYELQLARHKLKYGDLLLEEGDESAVRLALLPNGGPSGQFFVRMEDSEFCLAILHFQNKVDFVNTGFVT
ncbi:hypothetical protein PTKIN_Ptkin15bG0037700 [Pterospermum kingtungense]